MCPCICVCVTLLLQMCDGVCVCVVVCVVCLIAVLHQNSTHVCDWHMLNPSLPDWGAISLRLQRLCVLEQVRRNACSSANATDPKRIRMIFEGLPSCSGILQPRRVCVILRSTHCVKLSPKNGAENKSHGTVFP